MDNGGSFYFSQAHTQVAPVNLNAIYPALVIIYPALVIIAQNWENLLSMETLLNACRACLGLKTNKT